MKMAKKSPIPIILSARNRRAIRDIIPLESRKIAPDRVRVGFVFR